MPNDHGDVMYMLGKIESHLGTIDTHLAKLNSKVAKHEGEMGAIKLAAAKFGGIVITVTAIFGFVWTFLAQYIKNKLGLT